MKRSWSWKRSVTFVSYLTTAWAGAAVCAPSAITPTAATPITTANRLLISCFFFVLALISGLLRVVASGLPTSRGSGAGLTARSLQHGGTHSAHKGRAGVV